MSKLLNIRLYKVLNKLKFTCLIYSLVQKFTISCLYYTIILKRFCIFIISLILDTKFFYKSNFIIQKVFFNKKSECIAYFSMVL